MERPDVTFGPRWTVHSVAETGSTNTDLVASAVAGAPDGTVLVAGHQTAGRGRLNRIWDAPPGTNLLVSILFRPAPTPPQSAAWMVALAAMQAVENMTGRRVALKWPNDLVIDDAKLAGILAQVAEDAIVVGLGLNVGWAPEGATRVGGDATPIQVLGRVLAALDEVMTWPLQRVLDACREASATVGRRIRAERPDGTVLEGRALDLDDQGRLVVLDDCAVTHTVDAADVVHLRPRPGG